MEEILLKVSNRTREPWWNMVLITLITVIIQSIVTTFIGSNYLTWSSSIHISLGAKDRLGFIDGTICNIPEPWDDNSMGSWCVFTLERRISNFAPCFYFIGRAFWSLGLIYTHTHTSAMPHMLNLSFLSCMSL